METIYNKETNTITLIDPVNNETEIITVKKPEEIAQVVAGFFSRTCISLTN